MKKVLQYLLVLIFLFTVNILPAYGQNDTETNTLNFTSSNLPIVVINTNGQYIPDEPKIMADFQIIYNGPGVRNNITDNPYFSGKIGIEIRGSSSQSFPKKSYGFETWNLMGTPVDTSLLGMPSESDWILNANYTDKTFCRNTLAYSVFSKMGHYATRFRYTEVVLNNNYIGIYILSEKIKRDKNRVDIADLNPDENSGDPLTGGYIVKIDKTTGSGGDGWSSLFPPPVSPYGQEIFFQYEYPSSLEITQQQKNYIRSFMYNFESSLAGSQFADTANGFRKWADEASFIDYFIVNEISKNVDGYRLSTFMHKDRDSNDNKLHMGPVWDYDIAWYNANYYNGEYFWGWAYQFNFGEDWWQVPFWWSRLLEDTNYANNLQCRWLTYRQTFLSNDSMNYYIDSVAGLLDEAQVRNFDKWPILGEYVWPNPYPFYETYAEEVFALKTWIHNRMNWLDMNLPGTCDCTGNTGIDPVKTEMVIYPNPATEKIFVRLPVNHVAESLLSVIDLTGRLVIETALSRNYANGAEVNVNSLKPGIYTVRVIDGKNIFSSKFVKK